MSEDQFRDRIHELLKRNLANYTVKRGENLLYKILIDANGQPQPSDLASPKRGQLAFQTDILIKNKNKVPLVVIELKSGGFSTHDVLNLF